MIGKKSINNISISYAITVHNEDESLALLLESIHKYITSNDEIVLLDDYSTHPQTLALLSTQTNVHKRKLDNNYSAQKNYLNFKCKRDYIFQLDADELPTDKLLSTLPKLIANNHTTELFWIPRQNNYIGVTAEHIKKWNWKVDKLKRINYPDYQGRLFKNKPTIRWTRQLHERITGIKNYFMVPANKGLDIIHKNPVERQINSNIYYIKHFSRNAVNGR